MEKVNLQHAFGRFYDHWSPKVAGTINDTQLKLVKFQGEFVWHHHEQEDELFLVYKGSMLMRFRDDEDVRINAGEFLVVPRGVEHLPVAEEECELILLEPATTLNTGNVVNERTVHVPDALGGTTAVSSAGLAGRASF